MSSAVAGLRRRLDEDVDGGARGRQADAEDKLQSLDRQIAGMKNYFQQRPSPDRVSWGADGTIHVGSDSAGRVWFDQNAGVAVRVDGDGG